MNRTVKSPVFLLLFLFISLDQAKAVQSSGSYITTEPTDANVSNWTTGWGSSEVTGWDYVGSVNHASGVYLGNGWVLTAAHVGAGTFTLQGITYTAVAGSARGFSDAFGTADLTLFQIVSGPDLPQLVITETAPLTFSSSHPGTQVVMIGYGGGYGETWGLNTVTNNNLSVTVQGYSYVTVDFKTTYGTTTAGETSITNNAKLVTGDSGGGAFTYDSTTNQWLLAGINEAVAANSSSYFVELSHYASQINNIVNVPEPQTYVLLGTGFAVFLLLRKRQHGIPLKTHFR